jgi:hypothetical protein
VPESLRGHGSQVHGHPTSGKTGTFSIVQDNGRRSGDRAQKCATLRQKNPKKVKSPPCDRFGRPMNCLDSPLGPKNFSGNKLSDGFLAQQIVWLT